MQRLASFHDDTNRDVQIGLLPDAARLLSFGIYYFDAKIRLMYSPSIKNGCDLRWPFFFFFFFFLSFVDFSVPGFCSFIHLFPVVIYFHCF